VVLIATAVAGAQETGDSDSTFSTHPWTFGPDGGSGGKTEVRDVRVPINIPVIPVKDRAWGLNLRMVVYAGIYDFQPADLADLNLSFQSLAVTPGVEFLVPAGGAWMLKPFTEIGYARDLDNKVDLGQWSVGLRTLAAWPVASFDLTFGTKVQYLSTFRSDVGVAEDFGQVQMGFDGRHPLPVTLAGEPLDLGLYVIRNQFIDALISRPVGEPLEVRSTTEIGLSFGTSPRARVWGITLPRLGLGYRFGDNVRGFRLNFGFPF
jgi:hypothetical protein